MLLYVRLGETLGSAGVSKHYAPNTKWEAVFEAESLKMPASISSQADVASRIVAHD